jgi:hypothetical protein
MPPPLPEVADSDLFRIWLTGRRAEYFVVLASGVLRLITKITENVFVSQRRTLDATKENSFGPAQKTHSPHGQECLARDCASRIVRIQFAL